MPGFPRGLRKGSPPVPAFFRSGGRGIQGQQGFSDPNRDVVFCFGPRKMRASGAEEQVPGACFLLAEAEEGIRRGIQPDAAGRAVHLQGLPPGGQPVRCRGQPVRMLPGLGRGHDVEVRGFHLRAVHHGIGEGMHPHPAYALRRLFLQRDGQLLPAEGGHVRVKQNSAFRPGI